jgi:Tfp pilus assembly protein PilW
MKFLIKEKNKGLSMIELIVVVAIFIITITIVTSLLMSALKGLRKNIALQNVQDNARFMVDFMTKELRMSTINTANGTYSTLSITRHDLTNVTYSFSGNNLVRTSTSTGPINSTGIVVTGSFYISGFGFDAYQPKVTMVLKIEDPGNNPEERAVINVQATLSQRNPILDL